MRSTRAFMAVVAVALAALALTAAAASAQALEVREEGGLHCPGITTSGTDVDGGCLIHATSNGMLELRKHVFGIESHITTCTHEWHARADENGTARVLEIVYGVCNRQACKDAAGEVIPWAASGNEGPALEGTEYLTVNFCVEPAGGGADETCEIDLPFQTYQNQHRAEIGHATEMSSHGVSGFRCELVGHWNTETGGVHDGQAEQEGVVTHNF